MFPNTRDTFHFTGVRTSLVCARHWYAHVTGVHVTGVHVTDEHWTHVTEMRASLVCARHWCAHVTGMRTSLMCTRHWCARITDVRASLVYERFTGVRVRTHSRVCARVCVWMHLHTHVSELGPRQVSPRQSQGSSTYRDRVFFSCNTAIGSVQSHPRVSSLHTYSTPQSSLIKRKLLTQFHFHRRH